MSRSVFISRRFNLHSWFVCGVLAVLGATLLTSCATTERRSVSSIVAESEAVPDVSSETLAGWTSLDGRTGRLTDYKGEVVVLDFYATWCPPCRDEVPHLNDLQQRHGDDGLRVVGLNVGGDEDQAQIPAFVEELNINYQLGSPAASLVDTLMRENTSIPQTFVFDRSGKLHRRFVGYNPSIARELEQTIQEALAAPAN